MFLKRGFLSFILVVMAACSVITAQENDPTVAINYTTIHLAAKASSTVEPDTTQITLQLQYSGRSKEDVQSELNKRMRQILDTIPNTPTVELSTGGYHVFEGEDLDKRRRENWEASQYVTLLSKNTDHIASIAEHLQEKGLIIQSTQHSVSDELAKTFTSNLRNKAIEDIKVQAREIAATLNKSKIHISSMRFSGGSQYGPRLRAMAMESSHKDAPVLEPGQQEVSVHVNAVVLLK